MQQLPWTLSRAGSGSLVASSARRYGQGAVAFEVGSGQHFLLRRTIAAKLIGDDYSRHVGQPLAEFPEERLGRGLVPPTLGQAIEDMAATIDRPPQLMLLTTNAEKYLIPMLFVAGPRAPEAELIGILLAELTALLADDVIRHDDATGE